jgi:two-component system sensor histidine kinase RegB
MNNPQSSPKPTTAHPWPALWPGGLADDTPFAAPTSRGRVRLRTLSNLRWLAVGGQSATLFFVYFGLSYHLPLWRCLGVIAASIVLNILLALRFPATHRLTNREATVHLAYDVLQLAALLYLTGGLENPFALMFLAPVVIAASTLNLGNTLMLAGLAFSAVSLISVVHQPLPWAANEALVLPALYQGGIWASIVIGIGFTSIYAWRIASEAARMSAGLTATQLALAREQRMATIGALATAAAHELGTPLGTIAVVSRELERELPPDSPQAEDARLLREQAERCRTILTTLSHPAQSVVDATKRLPLGAVLDDLASLHRSEDLEIAIALEPEPDSGPVPKVWRVPELLHGLGNLIANAADFARSRIDIRACWDARSLTVSVEDDGPGFAPDILERIGEPYVTSRPGVSALGETELGPSENFTGEEGMGLGFFIAKTLIEQTGGRLQVRNRPGSGAWITARWPRGALDGETPPGTASTL